MVQSLHLQNSLTPRKSAVSSCDRRESPAHMQHSVTTPVRPRTLKSLHAAKPRHGSTLMHTLSSHRRSRKCRIAMKFERSHTACVLFGPQLIDEDPYAQEVDDLCHDEEVVMVLYHKPQQEQKLHRASIAQGNLGCFEVCYSPCASRCRKGPLSSRLATK